MAMDNLNFKEIKRKQTSTLMAEVTLKDMLSMIEDKENNISIGQTDTLYLNELHKNGADLDTIVGFIAKNPNNKSDMWFINYDYAKENFNLFEEKEIIVEEEFRHKGLLSFL